MELGAVGESGSIAAGGGWCQLILTSDPKMRSSVSFLGLSLNYFENESSKAWREGIGLPEEIKTSMRQTFLPSLIPCHAVVADSTLIHSPHTEERRKKASVFGRSGETKNTRKKPDRSSSVFYGQLH